ncbi:hypothetical protein SO802_008841 [Lithocarpus litseifolius]|uniref:Uncharacterized protein n=1 Tax=Lithocarpus litseifolius TaxID=425828 RepID=A0AAW2DB56_9ROSI
MRCSLFKNASNRTGLGYDFSSPSIASTSTTIFIPPANNVETENNNVKNELGSENVDKGKSILRAPPKLDKKEVKNPRAKKVPIFVTRVRGIRIVVTPDIVSDMLHVLRVEHLDYLGCERLRTVSKDELMLTFCERPSDWGDRQFTPYSAFAKESPSPSLEVSDDDDDSDDDDADEDASSPNDNEMST